MGMVRQHQCRAHRWSSPPLDHQTVEFGAKGRAGPSSGVAGQLRWAGRRGGQGGGGLHTHPLLPGGVRQIAELGKDGGWVGGKEVRWGATHRLIHSSTARIAVLSPLRCTWGRAT